MHSLNYISYWNRKGCLANVIYLGVGNTSDMWPRPVMRRNYVQYDVFWSAASYRCIFLFPVSHMVECRDCKPIILPAVIKIATDFTILSTSGRGKMLK